MHYHLFLFSANIFFKAFEEMFAKMPKNVSLNVTKQIQLDTAR